MADNLTIERQGSVGVLMFRRPARLNALSAGLVRDFHDVLDDLDRDLSTRVVILTGDGRGFCSGTDLTEAAQRAERGLSANELYRLQQSVASLTLRIREIHQPVIAAIHGAAVGGGFSLACAADIRVADPSARFSAAFIRVGASGGDMGLSWLLPRIVGSGRAADLLYTGRFVDAVEALRIGVLSRLVSDGEHIATSLDIAADIVRNSPFGVRMTKELVNSSLDGSTLRQQIALENRTQALCVFTDDHREAVAAFTEKRPAESRDR